MPLAPGQVLNNRYRIVKLLGQGGFGAVYRAWDMNMERPRALKENLDTSPEAQRQFKREAQILGDLTYPNLPKVIDHFTIPGQGQYLVMEYVEGEDLQQMLDRSGGPLPEAQALAWIGQVCEALTYLHSQNPPILHRDVKPANIKIRPDGCAVLVDFGIAKVYDPVLRTTVGARAVTPGYSPIEQYGSGGRSNARTDVYALGATLYALLTGQAPVEVPERNMGVPLPPPRALNAAVSPRVEAAALKALAVLPEDRWQSVAEFSRALLPSPPVGEGPRVRGGTVVVPTQPPALPTPVAPTAAVSLAAVKPALPVWVWLGGLAVVILLLGVLLGKGLGGGASPTAAPAEAALLTPTATMALLPAEPLFTPTATWTTAAAEPLLTETPSLPAETAPVTTAGNAPMVLIPAGEFHMGSESGESDEKPVHTVYLDDYYIDVYEVTNARYAECEAAGKCDLPQDTGHYNDASYAEHPVVYVDWHQVQAYCQWRGGSLPTEAQWEKAARGGLEGVDYPWGDEAPVCQKGAPNGAKFDDDAGCNNTGTEPVGSYSANGYGLYDMAGNVWEWVWDWYSSYSSSSARNPTGPESGSYKALRGGSWDDGEGHLRVAYRASYVPDGWHHDIGFRCALPPGK